MTKVDAETLRRMYLEEGKTIEGIAKELQVAIRTVEDGLIRWRIPRRKAQEHRIPAILTHPEIETVLRHLYIEEGYNSGDIAELLQVSRASVLNALKRWHIPRRRGRRSATVVHDENALHRLYTGHQPPTNEG